MVSFQEMLEALVLGKYQRASHAQSDGELRYDSTTQRFYWNGDVEMAVAPYYLTNEWTLLHPVIEYDTKEVTTWTVLNRNHHVLQTFDTQHSAETYAAARNNTFVVQMKGTINVPRAPKRIHKVTVDALVAKSGYVYDSRQIAGPFDNHPEVHDKIGKLTFEWEV